MKRKKNEEEEEEEEDKTKQTNENKTKTVWMNLGGRNEERQMSWQQANMQNYVYSILFEHLSSASFQDEP